VLGDPFKAVLEMIALFHNFKLRPEHLVVGFLLGIQFLQVREHHGELRLHVTAQVIRISRFNHLLQLNSRHGIIFEHWKRPLPR